MRNKGFTLTELLIALAIIGILSGIAVTAYIGTALKAARAEAYSNLESLKLLEEQIISDTGDYTISLGTCSKDIPDGNVGIIQAGGLRGFQPCDPNVPLSCDDISFSYCIESNTNLAGENQDPCFRASAFGNTNTRVDGDVFMIDCNNTRNF